MYATEEKRKERRLRAPRRPKADARMRLERRPDGRLWVVHGDAARAVRVQTCFPWSEPTRHLSLRDADEEEVAFVRDPRELDDVSRSALEGALAEAGFVLEVERIDEIEEEIEIRHWKVVTRQGRRSFQTPRDEWPRDIPGGGLLIRDVAGDLFWIPDPEKLDRRSQNLLWAYAD